MKSSSALLSFNQHVSEIWIEWCYRKMNSVFLYQSVSNLVGFGFWHVVPCKCANQGWLVIASRRQV